MQKAEAAVRAPGSLVVAEWALVSRAKDWAARPAGEEAEAANTVGVVKGVAAVVVEEAMDQVVCVVAVLGVVAKEGAESAMEGAEAMVQVVPVG